MNSGARFVLDASALLAYLLDEPGGDQVDEALVEGARISAVNWCEVLSKLTEAGADPAKVRTELHAAGAIGGYLTIVPFDEGHAALAARLRPLTRNFGLGLADRACLAVAQSFESRVLTADRSWRDLKLGIQVQLVR